MASTITAQLIEIFSSIQGEGLSIGEPQTFLRFQGCGVGCRWCDTPASFERWSECRIEDPPGSGHFARFPNPVAAEVLAEVLDRFGPQTLSLTGGEPLEQSPFLQAFLPLITGRSPVFLETAGVHPEALAAIIDRVDTVSMDWKLPSSTRIRPFWTEHEAFLKIAARKTVYCKAVITPDTSAEDLQRACRIIAAVNPSIPLVLQPVSNRFKDVPMTAFLQTAHAIIPNVRILPQLHKWTGWR